MANIVGVNVQLVEDNTRIITAQFDHESDALSVKLAERCVFWAQQFAPVETGRLKSEITVMHSEHWEAQAVSPTFYGVYREYGTRYQAAHPYMLPAYLRTKDELDFIARQVYSL